MAAPDNMPGMSRLPVLIGLLALNTACPRGGYTPDPTGDTSISADSGGSETGDTACDDRWYFDGDSDGVGDPATEQTACESPGDGWISVNGDCDDTDPQQFPGNSATIDGVDSDCDGRKDWLVHFAITADDAFDWCLDSESNVVGSGSNWQQGYTYDLWLPSGTHTVGIKGWDTGMVITAAIAEWRISTGDSWATDGTWRYDPAPASEPGTRTGWCSNGFDDSSWQAANVIGPAFTTSPWTGAPSDFPSDTAAQWIWDHYPVNLNTQYLRKEFVLP